MSEWINIKTKMPKPFEHVLINGHDGIFCAYRESFEDFPAWYSYPSSNESSIVFGITHWMPLPLPPKE